MGLIRPEQTINRLRYNLTVWIMNTADERFERAWDMTSSEEAEIEQIIRVALKEDSQQLA